MSKYFDLASTEIIELSNETNVGIQQLHSNDYELDSNTLNDSEVMNSHNHFDISDTVHDQDDNVGNAISSVVYDDDDDVSCTSSTSDDDDSDSDDSIDSYFSDSDKSDSVNSFDPKVSESINYMIKEQNNLEILSCFLRNNFSASACKDILSTMKRVFKDCSSLQEVSYENMWKLLDGDMSNEFHYCEVCNEVFPDNSDIFSCATDGCSGLRYKGTNQRSKSRKPKVSFVLANVKKQLKNLLESPGIWDDIKKNKRAIGERHKQKPGCFTDITDGSLYKTLCEENNFLSGQENTNLTAVFNTDGINLYSSTKVELWPIFLVLNELSPRLRFARENMIIAGIWQGKGKPPFRQYLQSFSSLMNEIYDNGITVILGNAEFVVKLAVICASVDLPAKAGVLNMTYFNGAESCVTCEEPGKVVKQGKGHSRCFPYRSEDQKYPLRTQDSIHYAMNNSSETHRLKGFKGLSGLIRLKDFQFVLGMPPDYMHGVLLGVTKNLMYKWFSSTQCKKDYFVGNKLKLISTRMKTIQPPEFIERLPRDLEKHYSNFKATELQSWLLYYAIPCLIGILKEAYLEHFALLSEAVYLLLGDSITIAELQRAELLLNLFYSQFTELYPEGSSGLNVHNIGSHLSFYVKKLGPLWSWSCFSFEDSNSMILQSVHGTGNVMNQIMRVKEAQGILRNTLQLVKPKKVWTNLKTAENCEIAGAITALKEDEFTANVLSFLNTQLSNVKKISRVISDGKRFYSEAYTRMKKRTCYIVLADEGEVVVTRYFVMRSDEKMVYAVTSPLHICSDVGNLSAGKHLVPVKFGENCKLLLVDKLMETLLFIDVKDKIVGKQYIVRMPNVHGHSVFK